MHIADFSVGMLGANGVVGANILIATGAAHAIKLKGESRVAVCIFGDGAINRGPFLEGLNWAKIFALPVLFFCEDNQFAATTSTGPVSAGPGPAARAQSFGIHSVTVNGNDVLEVDAVVRDTLAAVRAGLLPQGNILPGERDLSQLTGVSRITVRKAMQALEDIRGR